MTATLSTADSTAVMGGKKTWEDLRREVRLGFFVNVRIDSVLINKSVRYTGEEDRK